MFLLPVLSVKNIVAAALAFLPKYWHYFTSEKKNRWTPHIMLAFAHHFRVFSPKYDPLLGMVWCGVFWNTFWLWM